MAQNFKDILFLPNKENSGPPANCNTHLLAGFPSQPRKALTQK